ncbi:sensor histidine kinase [Flavihumibacter sp. UBA7668]|uniref:ATP-binding protein n=1 Tax=Flavihumibacter sp. UBA7668 TaxID=1946542 RepID=UPI0025BD9DCC|nr:sensor histidine kinase [Flavihumibacter sp. UBA7668]
MIGRVMRKRKIVLLALALSWMTALHAQKLNEDSLHQLIHLAESDSARVEAMQVLANYEIKHLEKDSLGVQRLLEAGKLAEKIRFTSGLLQGQFILANYHRSKSNWAESIELFNGVIGVAGKLSNDSLKNRFLMMAYNNLGGIYNINGDFSSSLENRLEAMKIVEKATPKNFNNRALIYLNIASDYRQLEIPAKALEYLNRTRMFFDSLSNRLKMEYYYEYYQNYIRVDSISMAKQTLDKMGAGVRDYEWSVFQKKDYGLMHTKLSADYFADIEKAYPLAMIHANDAITLAKDLKIKNELADGYFRSGRIYFLQQDLPAAIRQLQISYDSASAFNLKNIMRKSASLLAEAYAKKGDYAKAYQFEREARQINGLIYDQEKTKEINFLESRYQNQKKETEIAELQLSNISNELSLAKRNKQLWIGASIAAVTLILLSLLYLTTRQRSILAEKDRVFQTEQIKFLEGQQQVVSLQSMVNGQEMERTRIAKDLHDGLGGLFSTVKMHFSALQHENAELKEDGLFTKSYELIDTAAEEVRRIAHNMMPDVLIKMGLLQAVQEFCNSISATRQMKVTMLEYGMDQRLNASTEIMLYRIIQELLNNIIKHARASEAIIQFNKIENRLTITVEDNGAGFDLQESDGAVHAGLSSVQSRVTYLNGQLSIDSEKGIGTTVMMEFLINE